MSIIEIPITDFTLHPAGQFTGRITGVEDRGLIETHFGTKPKLSVKLDCDSATADDSAKYTIAKWFTVSSHPKSALTKFRITLLGRPLTPEEASGLDPKELLGRRCGYMVSHTEREGTTYANIDQFWPLDDLSPVNDRDDDKLPF
jgi:hypothetical protein